MEYILSTCGTSILTNRIDAGLQRALIDNANKREADVPERERRLIEGHMRRREEEFAALSIQEARQASAELNGILAYYDGQPAKKGKNDSHCLLCTDTWLGGATAGIVKAWLGKNGIRAVDIHRHNDLQTDDPSGFHSSLADLVTWCEENVKPRRSKENRVVFNLSGGFKPVTGFLQLLGMFYADETIYLFERSGKLLRIPRLPVEMADMPAIRADLRDFRLASLGLPVTAPKSGVYWFESDGYYALTPWGGLVFAGHKNRLYNEQVHESPSGKVRFGPKFLESCGERHDDVNRRVDLLVQYMENPKRPNPRTLDFKKLKGGGNPAVPGATHECDAWHDGAAKRIYCRMDGEAVVLLKLADAMH